MAGYRAWKFAGYLLLLLVSGGDNGDGTGVIPGADVTNIVVTCFGV
ncbi:MAG: hypothetical protein JRH14_18080 [Deltaproteobacteria bacterium]|nr:hypothetical protein [Deltaproteobacteria bacterium]